MESRVADRFLHKWSKPISEHERIVGFLTETYRRYCIEGLADPHFDNELATGSDHVYQQRIGELLLADALWNDGFKLSSTGEGPDFLAEKDGESFWIELITPEPTGLPPEYLESRELFGSGAFHYPAQELLLRWTAAISEKARKLLGCAERGIKGYLGKGVVKPGERYVIAVNDCLLSVWPDGMTGISQFPFPAEALFAVGPYELKIDPKTLETVSAGHQQRVFILNKNDAKVRTENRKPGSECTFKVDSDRF